MRRSRLAAFAACATLAACKLLPLAPAEADVAAKQFPAAPGQATVYVYRSETQGAPVRMDLYVGERHVAQTAAQTYVKLLLAPGVHTLRGVAENRSELRLEAEAGAIHFVWQEVTASLGAARNSLRLVDAATGRQGVSQCRLVASKTP